VLGKIFSWNKTDADAFAANGQRSRQTSEFRKMQKAKLSCVGGTLLFFAAAAPVSAQVTALDGDDAANSPNAPARTTTVHGLEGSNPRPSTDYFTGNSLIVTGPANKEETVPSINLDKLLSGQSGSPTVNDTVAEKH
jgi:hypothetical protein